MKCSECDGVGYKKISATSCAICERCGGMGEVKETNFQRITKSPEELAEFIADQLNDLYVCEENNLVGFGADCEALYKDNWLAWLKQESE